MTSTTDPDPRLEQEHDDEVLAARFRRFAGTECPPGELYDALCRIAADAPPVLRLLVVAPPEQRRPNLLLAALHDLVLAGDAHPLATYFESVGGARRVDAALHDAAEGVPVIDCRLVGAARPASGAASLPQIVQRLGVDPAPTAVDDERAVRWLRACIWPSDIARRERFDQAVHLARQRRWPVLAAADCTAAVEQWRAALPSDVLPVVFNSWVLTYLSREALARHVARMEALVQQRGVVWLSAEGPTLGVGDAVAR